MSNEAGLGPVMQRGEPNANVGVVDWIPMAQQLYPDAGQPYTRLTRLGPNVRRSDGAASVSSSDDAGLLVDVCFTLTLCGSPLGVSIVLQQPDRHTSTTTPTGGDVHRAAPSVNVLGGGLEVLRSSGSSGSPEDLSDCLPEPDLVLNHVNENHCDDLSDAECEENHVSHSAPPPHSPKDTGEEGNGVAQSEEGPEEGSEEEVRLEEEEEEEQPLSRYPSPLTLKRHIQSETAKVNNELRALITKEIRKPGRHHDKIFHFLKQIQGTLDTRLIFLQNIIKEAARFKKRVLIEQLENFLEEIHNRSISLNHVDAL
uniref:INTS6/SAGE1/DDX26B/CT45 C-terminal domain-containing protein n=1 Tax=Knipowitschia caucasica TaxID=637954 RepID=A0AAV2JV44_KNICA